MIDWIAWTKCAGCGYTGKDVVQRPEAVPGANAAASTPCPQCGKAAALITFPVFDVETIEMNAYDPMGDDMNDW